MAVKLNEMEKKLKFTKLEMDIVLNAMNIIGGVIHDKKAKGVNNPRMKVDQQIQGTNITVHFDITVSETEGVIH